VAHAKFTAWHMASGVPRVAASLVPTRGSFGSCHTWPYRQAATRGLLQAATRGPLSLGATRGPHQS